MYQTIELKIENGLALLAIVRPEALNALNAQVVSELEHAVMDLAQRDFSEVKALIITGSGEKAFVAGADIKEISSLSARDAQGFAEKGQKVFRAIEHLKIPVIAAVNGFALGGGLELALSCDFIYASEKAKFGLPEVSLGLIPGFGGTVRLARVVGLNLAREMIFSGDMLTADQALQVGLANKVFPATELIAGAQKIAQTISTRGPLAVATAKKSILKAWDLEADHALRFEAEQFAHLFQGSDVKEGTTAFVEKRQAKFTGK